MQGPDVLSQKIIVDVDDFSATLVDPWDPLADETNGFIGDGASKVASSSTPMRLSPCSPNKTLHPL